MKIKTLPKIGIILFFIIGFASCEEDFNTIGVDIIGDDVNQVEDTLFSVIAYSRKIEIIQTNNLPSYKLGVYNDPVYGKTSVDVVSQVLLSNLNPTFGGDEGYPVEVDSVYLYIPFYSEVVTFDDNETTYELDSIFGNNPIKLSVIESNYFLRDFDPDTNFEESQNYYSSLGEVFDDLSNLGETFSVTESFIPSEEEIILTTNDSEDPVQLSPGIRLALPSAFFQEKLIDQQGEPELLNNSTFKDYFRGIVFNAEEINGQGNMFLFDIGNANITVNYGYDKNVLEEGEPIVDVNDLDGDGNITEFVTERILEDYGLTFSGINVNMYDTEDLVNFNSPDIVNGDESLYLRGGNGYVTVLELLTGDKNNNGIDDVDDLRAQGEWLINEANLTFYVDQNQVVGGDKEPERILIYDLKNNDVLADFGLDLTQNESPEDAFTEHLGKLERGTDETGDYYKLKITNHIMNILNKDSTNVSLGLVVSQNVIQSGFQELDEAIGPLTSIPSSCIISPEGTVLHGNLSSFESKRLKFRIYYTDPNQ